jgi:hypothetical protein
MVLNWECCKLICWWAGENEVGTHKGSTELIKHPMAWGIEPLQVFLQTSSLQETHIINLQVRNFPRVSHHFHDPSNFLGRTLRVN